MKKLYKKGTVHPTPPSVSEQLLYFLPATILTLTAALSPEDREVLAYLISCSSTNYSNNHRRNTQKSTSTATTAAGGADHRPSFNCYCFRCYMNYWVRWDSSPNRELIHEIIDAFEDGLQMQNKKEKSKRERRKSRRNGHNSDESKVSELSLSKDEFTESNSAEAEESVISGGAEYEDTADEELEKGSVGRFLNFLGERFWGVWT